MSLKHRASSLAAVFMALVAAGCASTPRGPSEWDGLVRQPDSRFNAVFVRPDAEIPSYASIILAPATVQFARNWDPNRGGRSASRRLDSGDILAIKENLATMVGEIFGEELAAGGYPIVTEPGPDTLLVIPAIIDLYVTAPDTMSAGRSRTYTANSGRMTLVLEVRDSVTGETLARVVDGRSGRNSSIMNVTNRVTNTADARRIVRTWSQALVSALDSLYKSGPAPAAGAAVQGGT
ncbi:MAG: DUF3313 family protein [Chromatiales bacterium]|jgi:hypothetical protein|nr:DUF3313 family protein [Chromatiales bacterium]